MSFQFSSGDPALLLLTIVIGFAVLVMGRQMFWVFIAGLGFALGLVVSGQFYNAQFEWEILLISSIIAAIGALLAYTLQRLAAGIAGFGTGWYLTTMLMWSFNIDIGQIGPLIPYFIGLLCGVLLILYFDWGVIIASSLAGSGIIVSGMNLARNLELALLIMFAIIGIAIQAIWFMHEK